jgi:S1-C subfamily serine protease
MCPTYRSISIGLSTQRIAGLLLALVFSLLPSFGAFGQSRSTEAQRVFNLASSTVVMIDVLTQEGRRQGSAVAVSNMVSRHQTTSSTIFYTNWHVVDAAKSLSTSVKGTTYELEVLSGDPRLDMAIVVGHGLMIEPATITNSLPKIGDLALAIGNPRGLEKSISQGIISGIRESNDTVLIQTTAAISPGSSGGGLFDASGKLVGITTKRLGDAGESLNFAISANSFERFKDAKLAADIVTISLQTFFKNADRDIAIAQSDGFARWLYQPEQAQVRNYFAHESNGEFRTIGAQQAAINIQAATTKTLDDYERFRRTSSNEGAKREDAKTVVLVCQIKGFASWTIEVDSINNTVNGRPARFSDSSIEIGDGDTRFIINRYASTITAINKNGALTGNCQRVARRAF